MTAAEFLELYPATLRDVCTGGNCRAWLVELWGGDHILITHPCGGAYQPTMRCKRVMVGTYGYDGSYDEAEQQNMTAIAWADAALYVQRAIDSRKGLTP